MQQGMTQQVFIFIFALILMAVVLLFGIRQLVLVTSTADKIETLSFIDTLKKEVQTYANFDIGSTKYLTLSVPNNVNQVCFFNNQLSAQDIADPVFQALLASDRRNNIFVLPLESFQNPGPGFFIPSLTVRGSRNPLCVTTPDSLKIILETIAVPQGVAVEVKERL